MKIRHYTQDGVEITSTHNPAYTWRKNPRDERPQDFVTITQMETVELLTSPEGEEIEAVKLSSPVEEAYHTWKWQDGMWYCVIVFVIGRGGEIKVGEIPENYEFYKEFNRHFPNIYDVSEAHN